MSPRNRAYELSLVAQPVVNQIGERDIVHVGVVRFVYCAGDVPRDRLDMNALGEPQSKRCRDRVAVAMDRTVAPT